MASRKLLFHAIRAEAHVHDSQLGGNSIFILPVSEFDQFPREPKIPAGNFVNDTLIRFDGVDGAHAIFPTRGRLFLFWH
jgi:hypothetical protein